MDTELTIIHHIPGRFRLRVVDGCPDPVLLESWMRSVPGVISAVCSPMSNTVVVHYDILEFPKRGRKYLKKLLCKKSPQHTAVPEEGGIQEKTRELGLIAGAFTLEKLLGISTATTFLTPSALAVLYVGRGIIFNGVRSIFHPDPDTLTTASLLALVLKRKPASAVVIYVMSSIAELLTEKTLHKTRGFIEEMMGLSELHAWIVDADGKTTQVPAERVKVGDRVMVFHGEKVPFDGTVIEFEGDIDQSAITGEYLPKHMAQGSHVYGGSILVAGKIMLEVENVGQDLTINRMIRLIEESADKQADIQHLSERVIKKAVPLSFTLAGLTYFVTGDWDRVLNMLVIDYVCGIKLATATAISATIGKAAREGILVKGGHTLESLSKINTAVLDKTGTITEGKVVVKKTLPFNGYSLSDVLSFSASAGQNSSHPIDSAVMEEALRLNLPIRAIDPKTLQTHVGQGISVTIAEQNILVGNLKLMNRYGVSVQTSLKSGLFVAKNQELMGVIVIDDRIRPEMEQTISELRQLGIQEVIMLTGDNASAAKKVARELSVDRVVSEAMPQDKVTLLKKLHYQGGYQTLMVGDGINDAPALAHADIGITLGDKKTDIAMEAADIVIHSENPLLIPEVVLLSQEMMKTIEQNLKATLGINTTAILLGMFGLISPMMGAAIHNSATVAVVLNSAKLILSNTQTRKGVS